MAYTAQSWAISRESSRRGSCSRGASSVQNSFSPINLREQLGGKPAKSTREPTANFVTPAPRIEVKRVRLRVQFFSLVEGTDNSALAGARPSVIDVFCAESCERILDFPG